VGTKFVVKPVKNRLHAFGALNGPICAADNVTANPAFALNCAPVPIKIPVGPYKFLDISHALIIGLPRMNGYTKLGFNPRIVAEDSHKDAQFEFPPILTVSDRKIVYGVAHTVNRKRNILMCVTRTETHQPRVQQSRRYLHPRQFPFWS
jgi:hypothetical protein